MKYSIVTGGSSGLGLKIAEELVKKNINVIIIGRDKEKIDAIALGFGGQTALNLGLELYKSGILAQHDVKVLGSSVETIDKTEEKLDYYDIEL